jgi:hypothetical protein
MAEKPDFGYADAEQYARGDSGIEVFRKSGASAQSIFLEVYGRSDRERLSRLLPAASAFGTGYVDTLSDTFGDELFVFDFGGRKLVVTIGHVHA